MKSQPSVLVIDDEQIICDSCHRILGNENVKVDTQTNPKEGFEKAIKNDYDLLLLDLNMSEMDGMQLLSKLRKNKPELPVIIITGFPTKETKEESRNLGVQNYILKPFKPNEILDPVRSILRKIENVQQKVEKSKDTKEVKDKTEFKPSEKNFLFYKNGWIQKGSDKLVKAGGQLPVLLNEQIKSVRLPRVNELIYKGFPMAVLNYENDIKITIPSPVTGEIIEINDELKSKPYLAEEDRNNWISSILPDAQMDDMISCETRKVVFFTNDEKGKNIVSEQLSNLGYITEKVRTVEEAIKAVAGETNKVIIFDAKSLSDKGPEFIDIIKENHYDAKIIILNESDSKKETAYREKKIFYYAVEPVQVKELTSILYGAFCFTRDGENVENRQTTFLPQTIRRIQITNRNSQKVVLLPFDGIFQFNKGVGYVLIQKLLDNAYPIEIVHTKDTNRLKDAASAQRINEEKQQNDKIILIYKDDMNRIPGNINMMIEKFENSHRTDNNLVKIAVQPVSMSTDDFNFDVNTTIALAEFIEKEMTK